MVDPSILERAGRRIRVGIVGGGIGSAIGATHLIALRADGLAELSAGAMSTDPDRARASARAQLVPSDRQYASWEQMLEREIRRDDSIDTVVIATPPRHHREIAEAFLNAGIGVVCEKPMTATVCEAESLAGTVAQSEAPFALTHCYTGYPMIREMRALIRRDAIGTCTMVDGEFAIGTTSLLTEPPDPRERHWNLRPEQMGKYVLLGEVGSHIHNLAEFVTRQRVTAVRARFDTIAERRDVFDNAYANVEFSGGAVGRFWSSYVAAGQDHALSIRTFGTHGSLAWSQEDPEYLWLRRPGEPAIRYSRNSPSTTTASQSSSRVPVGHPEGYLMAFANIYRDFFTAQLEALAGIMAPAGDQLLPGADDGLRTLRFIDAAARSNETQAEVRL